MLRSLLLVLAVSWAAHAADPTLNVRYAAAMASLQPPFEMRRTSTGADSIYQGSTGAAVLTLNVHDDLVRKAELVTADTTVPDAESGPEYLRNFTIRGRFLTNVLPSWHGAALRWTDETIHALSPAAIAGKAQSRTTTREGTELSLELSSVGTKNGHPVLRVMLTAQPESAARR